MHLARPNSETCTVRLVSREYTSGVLEMKKVVPIAEKQPETVPNVGQGAAQEQGRVWYFQRGSGCLQEYPPEVCKA
jgi:hypothetical protein